MHSRMLRTLLQGGFPAPASLELAQCASASRLSLLRRSAVSGRLTTQRRHYSQALPSGSVLKVCVVGSGPAGFYTAHQLIKVGFAANVDNSLTG